MKNKLRDLLKIITRHRSAVVAFSGGVDSTLLASVAGEAIGSRLLLVTASSSAFPRAELEEARTTAASLGLPHRVFSFRVTAVPALAANAPDRCYHCKRMIFLKIMDIARREGYAAVFDGSNADDTGDYRPGRRALRELGVISPLCEARLTKAEIRRLSAARGLPTADKPPRPCLASRFPYGERITGRKLRRVENAESGVRGLGFARFRVRSHGDCARIEFHREEIERAWKMRGKVSRVSKKAGFIFVSIDACGYRSGAMDESPGNRPRRKRGG